MVSDIPPVGITQNERLLSCDTVLLGMRYITRALAPVIVTTTCIFLNVNPRV
jgi:hypothetical protein